jgi:hypothetical protein
MPTQITTERTVTRETATVYRGRPLIVELRPGYLVLREKGKRARFTMDYAAIYERSMKIVAEQARLEKLKARKLRRRGR